MANKFWKRLGQMGERVGGAVLNGLVPGDVYNKYNDQWAPTGVLAGRVGAGVAGQLAGPAGSLAGMVMNQYIGNTPAGMSFDGGIEFGEALTEDMGEVSGNINARLRPSVPRLGPNLMPPSLMNGFNPNDFAMTPSSPQSGIPQQQTSYGLSLPNFGAPPTQQVASAGGSAMGGSGQGGGGGLGGNGGGGLGMGNVGMLGTTRRYGQIKHS